MPCLNCDALKAELAGAKLHRDGYAHQLENLQRLLEARSETRREVIEEVARHLESRAVWPDRECKSVEECVCTISRQAAVIRTLAANEIREHLCGRHMWFREDGKMECLECRSVTGPGATPPKEETSDKAGE